MPNLIIAKSLDIVGIILRRVLSPDVQKQAMLNHLEKSEGKAIEQARLIARRLTKLGIEDKTLKKYVKKFFKYSDRINAQ